MPALVRRPSSPRRSQTPGRHRPRSSSTNLSCSSAHIAPHPPILQAWPCLINWLISYIQRTVLATVKITVTQRVSHRPIKYQCRPWSQRGTKMNGADHGDNPLLRPTGIQNHDKTLAWPNQPRKSETYRRQDDVFGYELRIPLSGVLLVFRKLNYKLRRKGVWCAAHPRSHQTRSKTFSSSRRVARRQVMQHFTSNGTDQCQTGSSNLLTLYREQPRSTRIVVT